MEKTFGEQISWAAGTPVLVVGLNRFDHSYSNFQVSVRVVLAGNLSEPWRAGRPIVINDGPMAGGVRVPLPRTSCMLVRGNMPPIQYPKYRQWVLERWLKGYCLTSARLGEFDENGCVHYCIFEDVEGLTGRLESMAGNWVKLQNHARIIVKHVERRHGSRRYGYDRVGIDDLTLEPLDPHQIGG